MDEALRPGALDAIAAEAVSAVGQVTSVPLILDIVCRTTGMGFAAVARVTESRWIACSVADRIGFGLTPGGELHVRTTICSEIRESGEPVVIDDVQCHPVYCSHPTPQLYGFRSYVSMPIVRRDGSFFGTLCAIDPEPRQVGTPEVLSMFKAFAALIASHLDGEEQAEEGRLALEQERQESGLREEFIAVLGHDLRNPLQAISSISSILRRRMKDTGNAPLLTLLDGSVDRMAALIEDVLDFARGRLGEGLTLTALSDAPLEPLLRQVLDEIRVANPERTIAANFAFTDPVVCDRTRVAQLLSNLVGNAITHGAPNCDVTVTGSSVGGALALEVSNLGPPIPEAAMARLFQPFFRGADRPSQQGLGLGLYIACMVAQAHGGTLEASSADGVTRFCLRIPPVGERK